MKNLTMPVIIPEHAPGKNQTPNFSPKRITHCLVWAIFFLLFGHIAAFIEDYVRHAYSRTAKNIIRLFDFNLENNVPTWFSALILAFAAVLLFIIYAHKKRNNIKPASYWLVLALIFVFLSMDESVQIHEEVANIVRPQLGNHDAGGFLYWAWVVPYSVSVMAVVAYFLRFVLNLPPLTRNLFFLSGIMYVGGALGLEFLEGYFFKLYGLDHIYNRILYCVEELLEMCGVTVFIYALLHYMASCNISISVGDKS
jgi:hypothetical protein